LNDSKDECARNLRRGRVRGVSRRRAAGMRSGQRNAASWACGGGASALANRGLRAMRNPKMMWKPPNRALARKPVAQAAGADDGGKRDRGMNRVP